jgi:hypothetical protein
MEPVKGRIAADEIATLGEGQIFVFGSNQSGRHGKGAAKQALGWGAVWGHAAGLQGRTYGIPTKNYSITRVLSIDEIKGYVDEFIEFAKKNPKLTFLVTMVGCGLAGYDPKDIAPLFKDAVNVTNVHLPNKFWRKIKVDGEEKSTQLF